MSLFTEQDLGFNGYLCTVRNGEEHTISFIQKLPRRAMVLLHSYTGNPELLIDLIVCKFTLLGCICRQEYKKLH